MAERIRYRKRPEFHVTAIQIDLDFDEFKYHKWDHDQCAMPGDWLVNNNGDVYTVKKKYFRDNYQRVGVGLFEKTGEVWAEQATQSGIIKTLDGSTSYSAGDYLVFDRASGGDGYAVKKNSFERMYEALDESTELTPQQLEYLERLNGEISSYGQRAGHNRFGFLCGQTAAIVCAALVPVVSVFTEINPTRVAYLVAVLGGASAVVAGLLSLFNWQQNWINFRRTGEDLKSHRAQFHAGAGIYADRRTAFRSLVDNCERILAAERGQWAEQLGNYGGDNE